MCAALHIKIDSKILKVYLANAKARNGIMRAKYSYGNTLSVTVLSKTVNVISVAVTF